MMDKIEILGFIACTFTTLATIPQIVKMIKTKGVKDLSIAMSLMFCAGFAIWIVYGILKGSWSLIIGNCISIICYSIILTLTFLWRGKNE